MFDGAVIILSLAPMVASTVANGPNSPWDAISLIITLRIWRVKRIIDGEWRFSWWLQELPDRLGKKEVLNVLKKCLPSPSSYNLKALKRRELWLPWRTVGLKFVVVFSCFLWAFKTDCFVFCKAPSNPLSGQEHFLTMMVPCWRCSLQRQCTAQLSLSMSRVFCIDLCGEAPGERSPREVRIAEQQQWLCLEGRT